MEKSLNRVRAVSRTICPTPGVLRSCLVANRGEIACRVFRAAKALGMRTIAVYAKEDEDANHTLEADEKYLIAGNDPIAPYLDIVAVIAVAIKAKAECIHPGYGFLAENVEFCRQCEKAGIKFVGPSWTVIDLFGSKTRSREFAIAHKVPVARGSPIVQNADQCEEFVRQLRLPVLLKAVNGGGGRGQRIVRKLADIKKNFEQCQKEAKLSFGSADIFVEEYLENVRHIEIQILGDAFDNVCHLFERDCSLQQRNQKVLEIAPARDICPELRDNLTKAACSLAKACHYSNAGTVEFLVMGDLSSADSTFVFLEVNPRIQVEHTITEEITGVDLVEAQLRICSGARLTDVIPPNLAISGFSMQLRLNAINTADHGKRIGKLVPPGVRFDTGIRERGPVTLHYDAMLAKMIVCGRNFDECATNARAALDTLVVEGVELNVSQHRAILDHPDFIANRVYTSFLANLIAKRSSGANVQVFSSFPGQVTEIKVKMGQEIHAGETVAIISAMKMFNEMEAPVAGTVEAIKVKEGDQVKDGDVLIEMVPSGEETPTMSSQKLTTRTYTMQDDPYFAAETTATQTTHVLRTKLKKNALFDKRVAINLERVRILEERLSKVKEGGTKHVKRHRKQGKFLPRERIAMICDTGTHFLELSALAGWDRNGGNTPSAGIVTGIGIVHGRHIMFLANDGTVNSGAYSSETFKKHLRAQEIAMANYLPCVYLADGGGANLASTEAPMSVSFVDGGRLFRHQAVMSSMQIPQISVACGRCTAGAAYTAAMCDELIMVKGNGAVYLGGPPLVRAATGEDCNDEDLGGAAMHTAKSGVADHFANSEPEAFEKVRAIIEHLSPSYSAPPSIPVTPPLQDPQDMLGVIPEDNKIPFDVREVLLRIVDGSRFNEFKQRYGPTIVCGFAHLFGFPCGFVGNNGMLFSESALKATQFIQICGHRGIPLVFLQNITGFIIGTSYEQLGITKDGCKMVTAVSCVPVPKICIVLGGSHGAGNYAMCGPAFDPRFVFLWPNARVSVMGGEQAADVIVSVKNAQLKRSGQPPLPAEMVQAIKTPIIEAMDGTATAYHSTSQLFDDGIIDPRETRSVLGRALNSCRVGKHNGKERGPPGPYGIFRL